MTGAAAAGGPPKLVNLYNLRTVGTARPCSMCGKDTNKCLANPDVTDFLYCCTTHLSDPGFAKPAASESTPASGTSSPKAATTSSDTPKVTQEDIDRVKKEYEEKLERQKSEAAKKDSSKSSGWIEAGLSTGWSVAKSGAKALSETVSPLFVPPSTGTAGQEANEARPAIDPTKAKTFVLHRHVFQLRVDQARRKWQAKQAAVQSREAIDKISALDLPSVPTTPLPK